MAYIEGLDLVTEGVLTLQKANEYLHECAQSPQFYEQFLLTKQEDGAILLTKNVFCRTARKSCSWSAVPIIPRTAS